ncbi:DUF4362 domain-containing protein [Gorillibacterium massiliense]|uniref:DUF4362 domain-containing protein n=1 Tax=Gorillibacterium massiliense TaxID=1280390 RepID=UPI0004B7DCF0|nr:DUF4362 domain-containing protein [Gorillibacterium massiliense]
MIKKLMLVCSVAVMLSACGDKDGKTAAPDATVIPTSATAVSQSPSSDVSGFPKAKRPYTVEQAVQNGDVVNVHGQSHNMDIWSRFLQNVEDRKAEKVRITQYTTEGDPIFYELVYDGDSILYTYDNSLDVFGSDAGRPSTKCKGIEKKKLEGRPEGYVLSGCEDKETGETFFFGG